MASITRKRIIAIRTETLERWFVQPGRRSSHITICEDSGADHVWVSLDRASALTGLSRVELCELVEANSIHWANTPEGHLTLCGASIARFLGEQ